MAEEKPKVEISIEASQKTGAITATATELEKLERRMTLTQLEAQKMDESMGKVDDSTSKLQTTIAQFVSVAAIAAFFKEAVAESLKEEEALRTLRGSVESTGASWEKYKNTLESFAAVQQAQTRFDDTVTFEVLGKLARATKTVEEAMRATVIAQNLSVATGNSLAQTTELVNGLLHNQSRAIVTATRDYGNYAGGATTAQQALDNLQRTTAGMAAAEVSHTKSLSQLKSELGNVAQIVGDAVVPELAAMAKELADGFRSLQDWVNGTKRAKDALKEKHDELIEHRNALSASTNQLKIHGEWTADNTAKYTREMLALQEVNKKIAENDGLRKKQAAEKEGGGGVDVDGGVEATREAAAKKAEIQQSLSASVNAAINDELTVKIMAIDAQILAAEAAGIRDIEIMSDGLIQKMDLGRAHDELVTQAAEEQARKLGEIKASSDLKEKTASDKKSAEEKAQKLKDKQFLVGYLNEVGALSNAKNKELAAIGKAAAIAAATISGFEAAAHSFKFGARFGGPILGAVMAALSLTATGAHIASIAGVPLATGGVVPGTQDGVQATIGEAGRSEAVLPLESPRAMGMVGKAIAEAGGMGGGGGSTINLYLIMPGLEAVRDPRLAREILEVLGEAMVGNLPEARTTATRIMDLAELNSRRSA